MWSDGSTVDYINWVVNEPNDALGREDCALMGGVQTWNDIECGVT